MNQESIRTVNLGRKVNRDDEDSEPEIEFLSEPQSGSKQRSQKVELEVKDKIINKSLFKLKQNVFKFSTLFRILQINTFI